MNKYISGLGLALVSTLVVLPTTSAHADTSVVLRPGDFLSAMGDTRANGHWEFDSDGLDIWTDNPDCSSSLNKAAEYWVPEANTLPDAASLVWEGTTPPPGGQLWFDYDDINGNGNDFNILVFEEVYGDNLWLTNGSSLDAKNADPSGAENGGNGSEWFGTLPQWKAAMPNARLIAVGFSLGSGVCGTGELKAVTTDDTTYTFTSTPQTTAVMPESTFTTRVNKAQRKAIVNIHTQARPANTTLGEKTVWKIYIDSNRADAVYRLGFDADVRWAHKFKKGTGQHYVVVEKNGALERIFKVRTGR